ncbi:hypothetical protein CMUS01_11813 [Colletotrichum musicola]|uniref:Uncharacterized protein n=1 Tax=Colletotrichum musicola TaxID=2175873 RepID=A0A8H6JUE8_9PEZI|nr:hypothetical protein CMUS01_11813 [Colletotrichum musicola]
MSDPAPWSSTLSDFPIRALQAHLAPNGSVQCGLAAQMFVGIDKDAMLEDPVSLDIGSRTLIGFLTASLPQPLNESRPGSMLEWWMDSAVNDAENTTSFLRSLAGTCSEAICAEAGDGLDPDVSGVGVCIVFFSRLPV